MKLVFFNIDNRSRDSLGHSLEDFRYKIGEEMIGQRKWWGVLVTGYREYAKRFVFIFPRRASITPYVSLQRLMTVRMKDDGHFHVG